MNENNKLVNEIYMLLVNSQVLYIKVYKERLAMFGLIDIMEVEMLLTFLPPWLTYTWLPENIAFELKCTEVHGVAEKTWRVFLVPRRKWLVKCTLLYSRVPDKSLFTGYQKHTAICFRPTPVGQLRRKHITASLGYFYCRLLFFEIDRKITKTLNLQISEISAIDINL
jgi:hypothetical protein